MTDLNNTVSGAALNTGIPAPAPALNTAPAKDAAKDAPALKKQTLSNVCLQDGVRAVRGNLKHNWNLVTSVVAMAIDAISRNVHAGLPIGNSPKPDARRQVPGMVTSTHNKVMRELRVNLVLAGISPFSNADNGVARILQMPRDSKQQKNLRRAQAEKLVDSPFFDNGLPVGPFKNNMIPAEFQGADGKPTFETKAPNESMKLANKYSAFIIDWFWNNEHDLISDFATRVSPDWQDGDAKLFVDLSTDDLETIRNHIRKEFGESMNDLESCYRAGRPKAESKSRLENLQNTFSKLGYSDMSAFLKWAQNKAAETLREDNNAKAATAGMNPDESDDAIDALLNESGEEGERSAA